MRYRKYFLSFIAVSLIILSGCQSASKDTACVELDFNMPKGIVYEGHTYWQDDTLKAGDDLTEVGKVKGSPSCNTFPEEDFMVTFYASDYKGDPVYKDGDALFIKHNDKLYGFGYYTKMNVQEEISKCPDNQCEDMKRHFVYKGMEYWEYSHPYDMTYIPEGFEQVGEIYTEVYRAGKEFSGGNMKKGTKLYASSYQNRFMVAEFEDKRIVLFENAAYNK